MKKLLLITLMFFTGCAGDIKNFQTDTGEQITFPVSYKDWHMVETVPPSFNPKGSSEFWRFYYQNSKYDMVILVGFPQNSENIDTPIGYCADEYDAPQNYIFGKDCPKGSMTVYGKIGGNSFLCTIVFSCENEHYSKAIVIMNHPRKKYYPLYFLIYSPKTKSWSVDDSNPNRYFKLIKRTVKLNK